MSFLQLDPIPESDPLFPTTTLSQNRNSTRNDLESDESLQTADLSPIQRSRPLNKTHLSGFEDPDFTLGNMSDKSVAETERSRKLEEYLKVVLENKRKLDQVIDESASD